MGLLRYVGTSIAIKSLTHSNQSFDQNKMSGEVYPFDVFSLPIYGSGASLAFKGARYVSKKFIRWYLRQARMHPYRTGTGTGLIGSRFFIKKTNQVGKKYSGRSWFSSGRYYQRYNHRKRCKYVCRRRNRSPYRRYY